jgi:hypothetical protein
MKRLFKMTHGEPKRKGMHVLENYFIKRLKNKVQVERNACEKFETIWSIPFLCGLEELIPPCQIYSGIYYNRLHSLRPAKEFIGETSSSQLCHSLLLCSDRTYSFHPMSLV